MVKIWNEEHADWHLELDAGGERAPLSLRTAEGQALMLSVGLGADFSAETARRAAAKAVKAIRDLGAHSAVLDASPAVDALGAEGLGALAQGAQLACYRQPAWKAREEDSFTLYITIR